MTRALFWFAARRTKLPGTHENLLGDPGCVICRDGSLREDEDPRKMDEIGNEEAKVEEVSATKFAAAARGIYFPHFLLVNALFFSLTIFVVDSSVASSATCS